MRNMLQKISRYRFLFEELVKRDFKKKYKGTVFGMLWSVLSPLLTLAVMAIVLTQFFGRSTEHYVIYLFCGNLLFSYFNDATTGGMQSLVGNAGIFSKVAMPKYMFLLSRNVQAFINFCLTLTVFFVFVAIEPNLPFRWSFFLLLYPVVCLTVFNIGMGMVLSTLYVFFRDMEYLYRIFTMLLMYLSAIFYNVNAYPPEVQRLFNLNPVYVYIRYFRRVVIDNTVPGIYHHLLCAFYALVLLGAGCLMYKKFNSRFLYYV